MRRAALWLAGRGHVSILLSPRFCRMRSIAVVATAALLVGCAADGRPSDQELARQGYWYHDGNHEGGSSGHASPQAIYNATHGIWLWPPAEIDIPN